MIKNQANISKYYHLISSTFNAIPKCKGSGRALLVPSRKYSIEERIEIPKKIHRGPTDILKALECTIRADTTAAHYKYQDDPFLIPSSNLNKRAYAMSKEAGKKAAHFIRQHHPDLFQHKEAEPYISMFAPPDVYNEESVITEEDLLKCIQRSLVSDAVNVYHLCRAKSIEIGQGTMQSFLELLCYSNMEDTFSPEFIEERWFRQSARKERQRKTWKDGSLAEELFLKMENPTGEAYSAIIQGMAKYFQADKALQLFEDAKQKGIAVNTGAYNSLIEISNFLKENYEMRWVFIQQMLSQMNELKVKPNLGTLNAVMYCLSTMGESKTVKTNALRTLKEFKQLGIEPSLATWSFLLSIFCKERGPISTILYDIMAEIEGKEFAVRDLKDVNFFLNAMSICRNHLMDFGMAQRVHNLLLHGNNYDLIGDSYKESVYYRHYFILACSCVPTDEFMTEIYEKFVPHVYIPEPVVTEEILKQIEATKAVEHVLKIWSDMIVFDQSNRERLLSLILSIMATSTGVSDELTEKFSKVAGDIYDVIVNQKEDRTNKIVLTGEMLGNILYLVSKNNDTDKALNVFKLLEKDDGVMGTVQCEPLGEFLKLCIDSKLPTRGIMCIQYCMESGYQTEAEQFAQKLASDLTLDIDHITSLKKIVGEHVVLEKSVT